LTQGITDRSATEVELAGLKDEGLREQLQAALANRVDSEQKLTAARARLEEIGASLRGADEERLGTEQKLPPLRDRIGELRLKEQAARLSVEQFTQQLTDARADEAALAQAFEANKVRPGALQAEIQRLQLAMTDLGAINMAALEELGIATERKGFLDAQSTDLREALDTLDNAIRRIDRETRAMLQQTFDQANRHFGELFPRLFGGGEAKLVMTGEEILDAGIEVRAQPPGKRNSTIHLLSGGEKALTAIALIFALFQLNPAPFCLLDEVDAPLDDTNTERFCNLVRQMSEQTQFLFISHNKITMEIAAQLVGVTMPEQGVSRVVAVDIEEALRLKEAAAA
jgi:chromosome segregation protein